MAAEFEELVNRDFRVSESNPGVTVNYFARAATKEEIDAGVRTLTYATQMGLPRLDYTAKDLGAGNWMVGVEYGNTSPTNPPLSDTPLADQVRPDPPPDLGGVGNDAEPPDPETLPSQQPNDQQTIGAEWGWDTKGGTQHITQSLLTLASHGIGGAAVPDHRQAIGVSRTNVAGCDIGAGKFRFTYTAKFPFVTRKYLQTLADLTYTVNDATFFGFAAGEVLFVGASGQFQQGSWSVSFEFEVVRNKDDIVIFGDADTPATALIVDHKDGHDYLWCAYKSVPEGDSIRERPYAAYVEQVYYTGDFKKLGI